MVEEMLRSHGLKAGHILAVCLPTGDFFISLLLASIKIGAVFCPLNSRLPPAAIEAQLKVLSPKLFFNSTEPQSFQTEPTSLPHASFLLFTSGSTSTPKIVSLTLANFLSSAKSAIELCNLEKGDTWLLSLPLYHVGGLGIIFRCLLSGASFTTDASNPAITHLSYVPTQLHRSWPIYKRLKCLLLGGGPIGEIPNRLPIIASYGMTETASIILGKKNSPHFLGFPLPGNEMKLSEEGEILLRGNSLFQGYWNGHELEKNEGWFATKDLGVFDPVNGFAIVGRKDNQFISGGENIQPEEIERELVSHPDVLEAIVVPKPHLEFGSRPVAFVRTLGKLNETNLKQFLAERLPKYKIPDTFHSITSETGFKLSRKEFTIMQRP